MTNNGFLLNPYFWYLSTYVNISVTNTLDIYHIQVNSILTMINHGMGKDSLPI